MQIRMYMFLMQGINFRTSLHYTMGLKMEIRYTLRPKVQVENLLDGFCLP